MGGTQLKQSGNPIAPGISLGRRWKCILTKSATSDEPHCPGHRCEMRQVVPSVRIQSSGTINIGGRKMLLISIFIAGPRSCDARRTTQLPASHWGVSKTLEEYTAHRNALLHSPDRTNRTSCNSIRGPTGSAPQPSQRSLSPISPTQWRGMLAGNNSLCHVYSRTRPLTSSPSRVSRSQFRHRMKSSFGRRWIASRVTANCEQQLTPTTSGTSTPGISSWKATLNTDFVEGGSIASEPKSKASSCGRISLGHPRTQTHRRLAYPEAWTYANLKRRRVGTES